MSKRSPVFDRYVYETQKLLKSDTPAEREKLLDQVAGNLAIEGLDLPEEVRDALRRYAAGELSEEEFIKFAREQAAREARP